jgi:GNAT superfamily N-acetyltransferase
MNAAGYIFLDGAHAGEDARRHMARLLFSTSYLEYCSVANKLDMPCVQLQQRLNIDPFLSHIRMLADATKRFAGFYTAATMAELAAVETDRPYRNEMQALDDDYEAFVASHTRADDYFVASLAIEPQDRGRGLFHQMFDDIVDHARRAGSPRLVLAVWESNVSLALYCRKGMRSVARFDAAWPLFFDRLQLLALPLETVVSTERFNDPSSGEST